MSLLGRAVVALVLLSVAFVPALAQNTINVPAGQPTIQKGIDAAQNGDTVLVAPGTYHENIDFKGKAITVTSSGGPSVTTIDGGAIDTVVKFVSGETTSSVLSGFTITNGYTFYDGGGITVTSASPTISNTVIQGNRSITGLGIKVVWGSPVIRANVIRNNSQIGSSGGGGAIEMTGLSSGQIVGNTIINNSLANGASGGGISLNGASPLISGNVIQGNTVYNNGGGIAIVNASHPVVVNNLITGNSAGENGGGIFAVLPAQSPAPIFLNNTVGQNRSGSQNYPYISTEVYVSALNQTVTFENNVIYTSLNHWAVYCDGANNPTLPNFSFNDVFSTNGVSYAGICTDPSGTNGNISADPLFVDPAHNDFHLQPNSPALDAGDNNAPSLPTKDVDGNPRIADGNNDCVATVDMGAYELPKAVQATFSPSSLDFGDQLTSTTSAPRPMALTSSGGTCLVFGGMTISGDFAQTNNCPPQMPSGTSCSVNVTFTPSTTGPRSGSLLVAGNFTGAPASASLSGNGVTSSVQLSPSSLDFGNEPVGVPSGGLPVTLTNVGTGTLSIFSISTTAEFTWTSNCGTTLAPNASCVISVVFTPAALGPRSGTLTISSNAPGGAPVVTLLGNGGGAQQQSFAIGFDMRATQAYVSDPPGNTYSLASSTLYPTTRNGVTFGWTTATATGRDRTKSVDPRLAGINFVYNNVPPGVFRVDLPGPGTYSVSLALGDASFTQCQWGCRIEFKDGNTSLFVLTPSNITIGTFVDANGNRWTAAQWPASNTTRQVTLTGSTLSVVVGVGTGNTSATPVAFLGITQSAPVSDFSVSVSPSALSLPQNGSATATVSTSINGVFDSAIALSVSGLPAGVTATFSPGAIPVPGSGSSVLTFLADNTAVAGTYPVTVTAVGDGVTHTTSLQLTVTHPDFTLAAAPSAVSLPPGGYASTSLTTTVNGGFNSLISLSVTGLPTGVTASLNPTSITPPGAGTSTLMFTADNTAIVGTYGVIVSATGGGVTHTATVQVTITQPDFTLSVSPAAITVENLQNGTATITTVISGGFDSVVTLSLSGLPNGMFGFFYPDNTIDAPGAGYLTLYVQPTSVVPGTYTINVNATGGGLSRTASLMVTIPSPDFTLTVMPQALSIDQGKTGTATVSTNNCCGFASPVSLSISGLPAGVSASFNPSGFPAPGWGTSTLTLTVDPSAAPGTFTLAVTASGGGVTHTAPLTLTIVQSQPIAIGFDMRATQNYVSDPLSDTFVLGPSTLYPTTRNGVTFGWTTAAATGRDRTKSVDTRLAGINFIYNNVTPGVFQVDLPGPGTYNIALALGDASFNQCQWGCRIEFKDGNTSLFVLTPTNIATGTFLDSNGKTWTAAQWPASNTTRPVTLTGSTLTVLVGVGNSKIGGATTVAFLGITH